MKRHETQKLLSRVQCYRNIVISPSSSSSSPSLPLPPPRRNYYAHTDLETLNLTGRHRCFFPIANRSVITMQADKSNTNTDALNDVTSVANEVTNLKMEDGSTTLTPSSPGSTEPGSFLASFKAFSKFGDSKSDGKLITLSQSDKWMKQAKVIDGKKITTTDTGIYFKKQKSMKLGLEQYKMFLEELAKGKKVELAEIKRKMANCGPPGFTGGAGAAGKAASTVDRLTDVTKYTGSHKQRFDETGKGKGIAGRKDIPDTSGYVQGYQNKDTYKGQ